MVNLSTINGYSFNYELLYTIFKKVKVSLIMDVVEKIDKLRKEKGWSVNKLASESLLTQSTVSNMFKSGAATKLSTLQAICDALEITLPDFFYENESSAINPKNLELITFYNQLDSEKQKVIYDLIKSLAK